MANIHQHWLSSAVKRITTQILSAATCWLKWTRVQKVLFHSSALQRRPCYLKPLLNKSKQISFPYSDVLPCDRAVRHTFPSDIAIALLQVTAVSQKPETPIICVLIDFWCCERYTSVVSTEEFVRGLQGRGDCSILKCFKVKHSRRWLRTSGEKQDIFSGTSIFSAPKKCASTHGSMHVPVCRRDGVFFSVNTSRNTAAHACSRLHFEMLYV